MRLLRSSIIFCVVALLALVVQEFAVRLTLPDFNPNNHLKFNLADGSLPILGTRHEQYRLIKNSGDYNVSVIFNQHGLRDSKDVSTAASSDVLLVGDSFAFGWGVEEADRVSEQLEHRLGLKVFNVATPGDVTDYGKLLEYAKSLGSRASNLVIMFNMYDDIANYRKTPARAVSKTRQKKVVSNFHRNLQRVKEFLLGNSSLYFLATSVITQNNLLQKIFRSAGFIVPLSATSVKVIDDQTVASTIDQLKNITRRYNPIILLIPNRAIWIGNNKAKALEIHTRFVEKLKESGLPFVDMRSFQERGGNPMRFHFVNDGHWRPGGHRLAADKLAEKIVSTILSH